MEREILAYVRHQIEKEPREHLTGPDVIGLGKGYASIQSSYSYCNTPSCIAGHTAAIVFGRLDREFGTNIEDMAASILDLSEKTN